MLKQITIDMTTFYEGRPMMFSVENDEGQKEDYCEFESLEDIKPHSAIVEQMDDDTVIRFLYLTKSGIPVNAAVEMTFQQIKWMRYEPAYGFTFSKKVKKLEREVIRKDLFHVFGNAETEVKFLASNLILWVIDHCEDDESTVPKTT